MSERPTLVKTGDAAPPVELVERVRTLLEQGGACALPTETVYGLAARADRPDALARLRELKGRPEELTFTWHVAARDVVERFDALRPLARRLVERYWPGPLTLVLRGVPRGLEAIARSGWTGVRLPAHATTAAILARCEFPVVMTSANRHGETPLVRAADVAAQFGAGLDLVVDGGPARLGEASGVLALGAGRFELLREGLLRLEDLRRTAGLRIVFVCTGNTCRSPMAETLARALLAERLQVNRSGGLDVTAFGFELGSVGTYAAWGAPASAGALDVMSEHGHDMRAHRSRPALPEALLHCDRIYGMTSAHLDALRAMLPPGRHAPLELLDPRGRDIADPMGGPPEGYQRSLIEIEAALRVRLDDWA